MNSPENLVQSSVMEMGLSDHVLIYCSRKRVFKIKLNLTKVNEKLL